MAPGNATNTAGVGWQRPSIPLAAGAPASNLPGGTSGFPASAALQASSGLGAGSLVSNQQTAIDALIAAKQNEMKSPLTKYLDTAKPPSIRLATFNLQLFGKHKIENPFIVENLVKLLRQFDVIALQEIYSKQQDIVPILVERLNRTDRQYDYVIGPRVGRNDNKEQFAFVFNTQTVETDRTQLYTVDDPEDLIHREPLVAWFRCKQVPPSDAFTFSLVNLHLDADLEDKEIRVLPELLRSIQHDGREEDDVILLGDFGASDRQLQFLRSTGLTFALEGVPTTIHGTAMLDNIVMPIKATDEFNGRSGVIDFLRQFNLSIDEANQISDHLPAWAEFFANEGGQPGRVDLR